MTKNSSRKITHIFCDIDGTLTEAEKGALDLDAISYLKNLKKTKNLEIVLVSGRGESATFFLSRDLGFQDKELGTGYICENGGVVCTYDSQKKLVRTYVGDKIQLWDCLNNKLSYEELQILKRYSVYDKSRISDIIISKKCPLLANPSLYDTLSKIGIDITDSGSPDVHIHFKKITKGEGIRNYILKKYESTSKVINLPEYLRNCIFCGNADNDIDAAKTVGNSIAVNNCSPGLANVADYIAQNKYGKGVIEGVEKILRDISRQS